MRKVSTSGWMHDCEQCGKRAPWGPRWRYLIGPIASKHKGWEGQAMPVRWCSDTCEDAWYVAEGYAPARTSKSPMRQILAKTPHRVKPAVARRERRE